MVVASNFASNSINSLYILIFVCRFDRVKSGQTETAVYATNNDEDVAAEFNIIW